MNYTFKTRTPNLSALRALARRSVMYPGEPWRHHGIGVLQRYLDESTRLHIWHKDLLVPGMIDSGALHDHRFDLESTVLHGSLLNREITLGAYNRHHPAHEKADRFEVYEIGCSASTGKVEAPIKKTGQYVLTLKHVPIQRGETYTFPKWQFHQTFHEGTTITLVHKSRQEDRPARLLAPVGTTPVHAFAHAHDRDLVERVLQEADKLLREAL